MSVLFSYCHQNNFIFKRPTPVLPLFIQLLLKCSSKLLKHILEAPLSSSLLSAYDFFPNLCLLLLNHSRYVIQREHAILSPHNFVLRRRLLRFTCGISNPLPDKAITWTFLHLHCSYFQIPVMLSNVLENNVLVAILC
jgi:hypothetical protein